MSAPRDEYAVVYVASPSTDVDETVAALQTDGEIAVETARSISAALRRRDTGGVDCVVSEYRLPDGDGLSFLETVREEYGSVPFVLYTADGSETIATRAFRNGVTDYVSRGDEAAENTELRDRLVAAIQESDADRERTDELQHLRQFKRAIFQSDIAVNVADTDGSIVEINSRAEEICGYSAAELDDRGWELLYPDEEYRAEVASTIATAVQNNHGVQEFEATLTTKGGEERTVSWYAQPLTDDQDTVTGAIAVGRDVTERRAHEQRLEELTTRLELALEETDTGVWEWDLQTDEVFWDDGCQQLFGYELGEFTGEYEEFTRRVHADDLPAVEAAIEQAVATDSLYQADFRIELPDGTHRWLQSRGIVEYDEAGEPDRMLGVKTDITDRKEAQQAIEETNEYYERIFERSSDYVVIADEEGVITDVTQGVTHVMGYDPEELIGTESLPYVHPDDRDRVAGIVADVIENPDIELDTEYRVQTADGSYRWVESRGSNHLDDPLIDGLVANSRDISDRKAAEQAAEETKQYYDRIFQQSSDYVLILDQERTVKDVTQGIERVLGYDPDELIGTDAFSYVHPEDRTRVADTVAEIIQQPEVNTSVEFRARTKDDSYRWMEARGTNHLDDPVLDGLVATVRDVSERKEREEELESLTTRFEFVLEKTNSGLWEWTPSSEEIILDEACQQLIGCEPGEFSGASVDFRQRVHDDDLPAIEAAIEEAVATDSLYQADFRIEPSDGEQRWIQSRGIVEYDEDGEMDRMLGIKTDITERKRVEQAVEETKQYYQRLFERSSDFVLVTDEEATIVDITEGVEHVMGHDPGEMIGMDALSNIHPDDRDRIAGYMADVIENPETEIDFEYRAQASDGSYRWLEARGSNYLDDPLLNGLVANVRDISERKRREQQLEELTTRLELALEETDTGVWEWNLQTDEVVWDEACERLFGYEPGEFPGTWEGFARRVPDDELTTVEAAVSDAIDTGQQYQTEIQIELPDGEQRWIQSRGIVEYTADGEPDRMLGVQTDITDRKEAQRAVEETKERYQRLFAFSPDYVTVVNESGTITDVTPGIRHVLGYEPNEVIGTNAFDIIHPEDGERIQDVLADVVANPTMEIDIQYRAKTTDGDYRWMEARGNNHLDDSLLAGVVVNVRDITQRKEREQKLARLTRRLKQKNEQLERLAQVVAHDLQTPLSTAEKITQLLRGDLDETDPEIEQSLTDLEATHQRLREFADHLPRLARESTDIEEPTECELQTVAEAAWGVVDTESLDLRIDSNRTLSADPERLQRLFENLFQNTVTHGVRAVEATGHNADESEESAAHRPGGQEPPTATTVAVGSFSEGFFIADDGPGIRPEQRDEIFEYGMGTASGSGFGLAIVRTIVEAHGWEIEVDDDEAGGARFEIYTDR